MSFFGYFSYTHVSLHYSNTIGRCKTGLSKNLSRKPISELGKHVTYEKKIKKEEKGCWSSKIDKRITSYKSACQIIYRITHQAIVLVGSPESNLGSTLISQTK